MSQLFKRFRVWDRTGKAYEFTGDFVQVANGRLFILEGMPGGPQNERAQWDAGDWTSFEELPAEENPYDNPEENPGSKPPPIIQPNWDNATAADIPADILKVNRAFEKMMGFPEPVDVWICIGGRQVKASVASQIYLATRERLKREPTWKEYLSELDAPGVGVDAEIASELMSETMRIYRRLPTKEEYAAAVAKAKDKKSPSDCFADLRPSPEMERYLRNNPAVMTAKQGRDEALNMLEDAGRKYDQASRDKKENDLGQLIRQIPPAYLAAGASPEEIVGLSVSRLCRIAETVREYSLIAGRLTAIEASIAQLAKAGATATSWEVFPKKPSKRRPAAKKIKSRRKGGVN